MSQRNHITPRKIHDGFKMFIGKTLETMEIDINESLMFKEWQSYETDEFIDLLMEKLGKWHGTLLNKVVQQRILVKMAEGIATKDSAAFLAFEELQTDGYEKERETFFEFLAWMMAIRDDWTKHGATDSTTQ